MSKRSEARDRMPANVDEINSLPTIDSMTSEEGVFDGLVCLAALCDATILDETRILAFSNRELREAEDWLGAIHLSASDNIIRKKRLLQPDCCVGVLSCAPFDQPEPEATHAARDGSDGQGSRERRAESGEKESDSEIRGEVGGRDSEITTDHKGTLANPITDRDLFEALDAVFGQLAELVKLLADSGDNLQIFYRQSSADFVITAQYEDLASADNLYDAIPAALKRLKGWYAKELERLQQIDAADEQQGGQGDD